MSRAWSISTHGHHGNCSHTTTTTTTMQPTSGPQAAQANASTAARQTAPRLACIACSSDVAIDALPHCIVHSCCGKPVCVQCLSARPRLATFCVRCEGVGHALRDRGPRADVTRMGQVVFDAATLMDESQSIDVDETIVSSAKDGLENQSSQPPPPYAATQTAAPGSPSAAFALGSDDNTEDEIRLPPSRSLASVKVPALLQQVSAAPSAAITGTTARQETAQTPDESSQDSASSLRKTLEAQRKEHCEISTPQSDARISTPQQRSRASSRERTTIKTLFTNDDEDANLTRQYWLRPNDSLMSLSLRFRVSAAELCKLNDLPASTASSTPHLIHTRQFLLIPEKAIRSALARANCSKQGSSDVSRAMEDIESSLRGPAPLTRSQKITRARREAQSRFRALVAQSESRSRPASAAVDVTPCDERAARAYITLMESELRFVDFGDGDGDASEEGSGRPRGASAADDEQVEDDMLLDAARQRRYDAIVQQAVARWAMDSDWERRQRAEGLEPTTMPLVSSNIANSSRGTGAGKGRSWTSGKASQPSGNLFGWLSPQYQAKAEPGGSRWKTVKAPSSPLTIFTNEK